ncbi:MAG TPA: DMT family transporter [Gaiellaceae bacterium]
MSAVDLMLLGTVLLWALNVTATRYALTHGFRPLAYGTVRYFAATALFWCFTWQRERSFRIRLADWKLVALAATLLFANQVCFVVSVHETNASTVALMLGATPVITGVIASLIGLESLARSFWVGAAVAFVGVGLVGAGGGGVSGNPGGDVLAIFAAVTWAGYSVAIAPLMRRYSPFRISALVLALGWLPLALVSIPQLEQQQWDGFGWPVWLALGYAIIGPLFLTNILWFTAIDRVGPSRATLFTNLQPFFAVLFALVLLSEHLNRWEIVGALAIATGILLERLRRREPRHAPAGVRVE